MTGMCESPLWINATAWSMAQLEDVTVEEFLKKYDGWAKDKAGQEKLEEESA